MSQLPNQELKAQVLSVIKDDGLTSAAAAAKFGVKQQTVGGWLRSTMLNAHTSGSEVQRLRRENQELKALLGELVLEKELRKRSAFGRS